MWSYSERVSCVAISLSGVALMIEDKEEGGEEEVGVGQWDLSRFLDQREDQGNQPHSGNVGWSGHSQGQDRDRSCRQTNRKTLRTER